jgi:hypothetical protein
MLYGPTAYTLRHLIFITSTCTDNIIVNLGKFFSRFLPTN